MCLTQLRFFSRILVFLPVDVPQKMFLDDYLRDLKWIALKACKGLLSRVGGYINLAYVCRREILLDEGGGGQDMLETSFAICSRTHRQKASCDIVNACSPRHCISWKPVFKHSFTRRYTGVRRGCVSLIY